MLAVDVMPDAGATCGMDVQAKIARLMDEKRLSQTDLAGAVGMAQTSISRFLAGRQRLYLDQAARMAKVLGVPVDYLADDAIDAPPPPVGPDGLSDDERHVLTIARHLGVREAIDRLLLNRVEPPTPQDDPRLTGRLLPPAGSGGGEGTGRKNHGA